MATSEAVGIATGPTVPVVVPYASWLRRVGGVVLDSAVLSFVSFLATGVALDPFNSLVVFGRSPAPASWWLRGAVLGLLILQAYTGSTPGKRVVGIAVLSERTGRPIGLLRTIGRELAHLVDAILFIGYLRPLWNARRRTFADSICATNVLVVPRASTQVTVAAAVVCGIGVLGSVPVSSSTTAPGGTSCSALVGDDLALRMVVDAPVERVETRLGIARTLPDPDGLTVHWAYADTSQAPTDGSVDDLPFDSGDRYAAYPTVDPPAGTSVTLRFTGADGHALARATLDEGTSWVATGAATGIGGGPTFRVPATTVEKLGDQAGWMVSAGAETLCGASIG